ISARAGGRINSALQSLKQVLDRFAADGDGEGMAGARVQQHPVVHGVCGFVAGHALPGIIGELRQALGLVDPGIPQDRRTRTPGLQGNPPVQLRVAQVQRRRQVQVDAVGLACEPQVTLLLALLPVLQGVDIAAAVQPFHRDLMDIADGEIAVQRLADGHGPIAQVTAGETDVQALVEADLQLHLYPVRPPWQRPRSLRTAELQYAGVSLAALLCQLPVQASYQAVDGRFGRDPVGRLHVFGLALKITEPGPSDRYAAAHRLALLEGRVFAEPDDRRHISLTVAEPLHALFGDQQFVVTAADAPAGKLVYFDALDINGHGWSRGWLGCVSDNSRRTGFPRRVDVAFHIHRGSVRWGAIWWIATRWIGEARSTHRSTVSGPGRHPPAASAPAA